MYRIIEKPVDVSTFITTVEMGWGVDPKRDMKKINMDENVSVILAMLHNKKDDATTLNEEIEDYVKKMLERNSVK